MKSFFVFLLVSLSISAYSQSWEGVGGGNSNSTHGLLTWDGKLVNLGSFNNTPCDRVATWDGTSWTCLAGGVGIVARAGVVWDGKLVVVGDFWNNFQPCVGCNGVAVWDGISWTALGNGVNNDVLSCTVWNNELVIAGDFTEADGVPVARIIKWSGTEWESVGPIGSFDNDIRCMVEFDGTLWVGGDFNNVGGVGARDGLVKYDAGTAAWVGGNSGVDLIGGVNESVRVLYVNPNDGNLYMGGEFPELIDGNVGVADFNMGGIAMYDGSDWTSLGTGLNEYCRAIHEYNGDIVAGGYFTDAGGTPANKIAKWDGTNWSAMGLGFDALGIDEYVKAATVWNGIFFAGGAYTQAEGNPMNYISQWYEAPTAAPVAWMTTSSTSLCGSGCIDFLDNSTNAPTSWTWAFPGADITSSTEQDPGSICWASSGTYTVSLEACNSIGCTTQEVDIVVENGATLSVNDATICSGNGPVTLTATPSVSGGSFLWTPGGDVTESIVVNPGNSTTYSVSYSYLGCTSSAVSNVTVISGFTSIEDIDACQNSVVVYPDGTTETITSSTSHISALFSIDGCDSTVTSNVNMIFTYNHNQNVSACENDLITYPDGTDEVITSSTSHLSALTSLAGCDSNVVTNVTMNSTYNSTDNISVCGQTAYIYPDGTSETITSNTSHTSNLSTANGCDSIINTNVTFNNIYSISVDVSLCIGEDYTYPDGTVSSSIQMDESHTSNLLSSASCDSIITTNVLIITIDNTVSESNNTLSGNQNGAMYQWVDCNDGNAEIDGETGQNFTPTSNGLYAVEITLDGCVQISPCISITTVGLNELNSVDVSLYPNPVDDKLFIATTINLENQHYEIIDAQGRVLLSGVINSKSSINVSQLTTGVYFLLLDEGEIGNIKFIKR